MSEPILKVTDTYEDFFVCTNSCKEGFIGFLTQNGHAICYEFKIFEQEINYDTHELELESIVHDLRMCRIISWEEKLN